MPQPKKPEPMNAVNASEFHRFQIAAEVSSRHNWDHAYGQEFKDKFKTSQHSAEVARQTLGFKSAYIPVENAVTLDKIEPEMRKTKFVETSRDEVQMWTNVDIEHGLVEKNKHALKTIPFE